MRKSECGTRRRSYRPGFTILELLVTVAIISLLAALLLPAIGAAREAARKIQCVSQLRQIGLALHNYHDEHACLPPGWQWEKTRRSAYGWSVSLLTFLDASSVYRQTHRDRLLDDPANSASRQTSLPVYLCPSDITEPRFTLYREDELLGTMTPLVDLPTANYLGVFGNAEPDDDKPLLHPGLGAFIESRPVRMSEFQRGLSNTFFIGERTMAKIPATWLGVDASGEDAPCRLVGNASTRPNCTDCDECEFASRHPGGANFLWGDGHVSLVSVNIDTEIYQRCARRVDY